MWAAEDFGLLAPLDEWSALALRYAAGGSTELIYAEAYTGVVAIAFGRPPEGHEHLRRAAALALDVEDDVAFFAAASTAVRYLNALRDRELVYQFADLILRRPRKQIRTLDIFECLNNTGIRLMERGDRQAAEAVWQEAAIVAGHSRDSTVSVAANGSPICLAFMDGRLEEALGLFTAMEEQALEVGVRGPTTSSSSTVTQLLYATMVSFLGRDPRPMLSAGIQSRSASAQRAMVFAMRKEFAEVPPIIQQYGDISSESDETAGGILFALLHACVLCSDKETVAALLPRFLPLASELKSISWTAIGRVLGDGAILLDRPSEAIALYELALDASTRARHRPELALTHLSLAELLLDHYPDEHDDAIAHLDFAIAELRDMRMQPALERALGRRGLLKA
jgi:tetratricopeptide (TPR) repeat protein